MDLIWVVGLRGGRGRMKTFWILKSDIMILVFGFDIIFEVYSIIVVYKCMRLRKYKSCGLGVCSWPVFHGEIRSKIGFGNLGNVV